MADREYMRKLIDEVLGADRNKLPDQLGEFGVKFTDEQVCKYYLVGFCPYLQFQNTKSDIGNCPKRYHEDRLKDQFLEEGERYREEYEREFMAFLDKLVNDLERRLRKGKDRLDVKPSDPTAALNPANDEFEERRTILDLQVKETLLKIEECGEEGKVQEAQDLMNKVEKYKEELEKLRQLEAENPSYRLEKKMEVCQTCGAFLIIGDALKRIEAHFEGRQHNGWARIRETLADLKKKYHSGSNNRGHPHRRAQSPEPGEIGEEPDMMDSYVPSSRPRDYDRVREREQSAPRHERDQHGGGNRHADRRSNNDDHHRHHHYNKRGSHSRSRSPYRRR